MDSAPASMAAAAGLLVLLPGFVTLLVERALAYQAEPSAHMLVARALVYSLLDYTLFSLSGLPLLAWHMKASAEDGEAALLLPAAGGSFLLVGVAVALGMVVGVCKAHDLHMRAARCLRLTKRTSREGLWLDILEDKCGQRGVKGTYVVVTLKDGQRVEGWPECYSDEYSDGPVLFLTQAQWLDENGAGRRIPDPGILLTGSQIELMEFYRVGLGGEKDDQQGKGEREGSC